MKVIFMGTPDFAVPTLDALALEHEVLAVVARPDKPSGRGRKIQSPPTVVRARELGIPVKQPRAIRSGPFPEWMTSVGADVAVVIAYGRILTPQLLNAPRLGCVNVHASLLPKYRGAAPIQWSVIRGECITGITTMQMDEGLDTGDILLKRELEIGPDETAAALWDRLSVLGSKTLMDTLLQLEQLPRIPQDHGLATLAPPLTKADGRIDWSKSAQEIHDHVRGVTSWPGAWTTFRSDRLKIWKTRPSNSVFDAAPGTVVAVDPVPIVAAGTGAVALVEVQRPGKRAQPGVQFRNGVRLQCGETLQ